MRPQHPQQRARRPRRPRRPSWGRSLTPGRWLLLGLALLAGALLWNLRGDTPQAPPGPSAEATAGRPDVAPPTPATSDPESLSAASGDLLPPPGRPAAVARLMARVLGGVPDLDPSHLDAMIRRALDPALPLEERVGAIRWLARFGSDDTLEVLERLLRSDVASPLRASVALALGDCPHPDALRILTGLLQDEDASVVLAAIRGLSHRRDPAAAATLEALVADASLPDGVRAEAASALGRHDAASGALREALAREGALSGAALEGLARQPFAENEALFRELVNDPEIPLDVRVEALEALGEGTPEAAEFLLEVARSGDDPALRSAAIEALEFIDEPGDAVGELAALVASEPDPDVRADLYGALAFHSDAANARHDASALVRSALAETTPRAQLEGYRMVASMLYRENEPETAAAFDADMVPWLQSAAESGDRYTRQLSIDALKLAGTPAAREALLDLSHSTDPALSESAEKALRIAARIRANSLP